MDISDTDLPKKGNCFTIKEGLHTNSFEWLEFERLKDEYFYPLFLKDEIFKLPKHFMIRTEKE